MSAAHHRAVAATRACLDDARISAARRVLAADLEESGHRLDNVAGYPDGPIVRGDGSVLITADVAIPAARIDATLAADRIAARDTVVVDPDRPPDPEPLTDEQIAVRLHHLRRLGDGLTAAETSELAALLELHRWRAISAGALPPDEARP